MTTTANQPVNPSDKAGAGSTDLPAEARDVIAQQLRKAYSARLSEPVPDKFAKLLEALAKGERS